VPQDDTTMSPTGSGQAFGSESLRLRRDDNYIMSKKIRGLILFTSVVIFVVLGPVLILKSQDIKIDWQNKKLVKTGGIFVQVENPSAEVYLNNKFEESTGFFSRTSFIKGLLPKKYLVEIKKTDYFSLKKNLSVMAGNVTEMKDITLFKTNYQFSLLPTENIVQDYIFSGDQKQILAKTATSTTWQFQIFDTTAQQWQTIFTSKITKPVLASPAIEEWQANNKNVLLSQKTLKAKTFYLVDYENTAKLQVFNLSILNIFDKISLDPLEKNSYIYLKKNNLYKQKTNAPLTPELIANDVAWFQATNNDLYVLTTVGFIIKSDFQGQRKEIINSRPISLQGKKEFTIDDSARGIFLNLEKTLFRIASDEKQFLKLAENTSNLIVSPSGEKLLYLSNQEVWLFEKIKETKEEKATFLTKLPTIPNVLLWLNDNYFLFDDNESINVADIDWRDNINILNLKSFKEHKVSYNANNKKLYVLSKDLLYVSEKILP